MLQIGIVGLPNVGKSTLFNALTRANAEVSNYPFCTIEANAAVVPVPDQRLAEVAALFGQEKQIPATIRFVDVAGLVRNAHRGEGLGNQFLGHLRESDALLHVVRCFSDPRVSHVDGTMDSMRDVATVETELILADLATVEKRLEKSRRAAKSGDHEAAEVVHYLDHVRNSLNEAQPARRIAADPHLATVLADLFLLTAKPVLYVANVGESQDAEATAAAAALASHADSEGIPLLQLPARLASDIAELPADEAEFFAAEMGLDQSVLDQIVRASYELLEVVTFFTAVGKEARAWTVQRGTPAHTAAGKIHSDMEEGFIKAEVVSFDSLMACGSWHAAREQGLLGVKGKDYHLQDGDVVHFLFKAGG